MQQKSSGGMTTKRLIAMIALAVLAVAVIVFAVREIRLYGDVQVEQSRTPTPVPGYGNVMQVTIDPSLPTPVPVRVPAHREKPSGNCRSACRRWAI